MLQSSLSRSFLPTGLNYLSYYGDDMQNTYGTAATWHIPMETPSYSRMTDTQILHSWDLSRSSTPCPLDLSLKPPPPNTPKMDETEEKKEEEASEKSIEEPVIVDDLNIRNYESLDTDEATRLMFTSTESNSKYYPQKFLLGSPNYHQQLLLTPQHHLHAPMTPPSTPSPPQCPRRKVREEDSSPSVINATNRSRNEKLLQRPKKKHARRLKFDEDTSSPVSGTVILGPDEAVVTGDIDPAFNIVEVTDEARAELAKIENRLGPYQCKLCRQLHEDAFQLAQHRCSRIAHVEYRCPECDKRFSCPANLASHRRWHKPRLANGEQTSSTGVIEIPCTRCDAKFTRQAALRKHLATQHTENVDGQIGKNENVSMIKEGNGNTETP